MAARGHRAFTAAAVMICTAAVLAATSAPALARSTNTSISPNTPVTAGSGYLALGDSVTFGYEESTTFQFPGYSNASNFVGYPEILGSELHLKVANPACPGETSLSLIKAKAQSNGCENSLGSNVGYRTVFPLHVGYKDSQLSFAVHWLKNHQNVRLVSLMIGANDAFVCQKTTPDNCTSAGELAGLAAEIGHNVTTILSAIRNEAHYNGQLAIVNYYSLDYSNPTTTAGAVFLNNAMDAAAQPFNVEIADGFGEFQAAAAHANPQGSTCNAGLLTQLTTGGCGIHPSYAGQSLLAQALEKAIRVG